MPYAAAIAADEQAEEYEAKWRARTARIPRKTRRGGNARPYSRNGNVRAACGKDGTAQTATAGDAANFTATPADGTVLGTARV